MILKRVQLLPVSIRPAADRKPRLNLPGGKSGGVIDVYPSFI